MRLLVAFVAFSALLVATDARADPPAPFVVTANNVKAAVRVQVSEGRTLPCDASANRMLFDGQLPPGEAIQGMIGPESACICVRSTIEGFSRNGWGSSRLACRPCVGRVCRPAPDPTIRVVLDTH